MKYLVSRANYERCTEGMSDADRAAFDREFRTYPDGLDSPDGRVDVDQVADAYARLLARETGVPAELVFQPVKKPRGPLAGWDVLGAVDDGPYAQAWWHCPKGNDKASWRPPGPWAEIGDGVYVAPPGTPMPELFTPDPGPAPTIAEQVTEDRTPWDYIDPVTLTGGWLEDQSPRRGWINDLVAAEPEPVTLADILTCIDAFKRAKRKRPRPQQLAAGEVAMSAILFAGRPTRLTASDKVVVDLAGIPIVADPELPEDVWRLVDADTGEVLNEGTIPAALARMIREMRETFDDLVDELADRTGTPRDLLWPPRLGRLGASPPRRPGTRASAWITG